MKLVRCDYPGLSHFSDVDRWLRDSFINRKNIGSLLGSFLGENESGESHLPLDMLEDGESYFLRSELPGVEKKDVKVEFENSVLSVSATRKEGDEEFLFSRTVSVPEGIDASGINAKLENGILTVTLPKSEERKPRSIDVS